MPSSNRAQDTGTRKLLIALLIVVGGFLAFCGLGMTNALVVALGLILAAAGPVLILVLNSRNKVRQYVYGTARVADISPRPTTDGRTARGRLKLVVKATGVNGATVSTVDPAIPLDKWPDAGATLPVQVLKGNPRKIAVVWDKVQSHQDAQASERPGTGAPRYSVDGDELDIVDSPTDDYEREHPRGAGDPGGPGTSGISGGSGGSPFERPAPDLPPDDRPTLTDLPPITAPVIEPVRLSARGDRLGQTRPAPRPTSPSPGATARTGLGAAGLGMTGLSTTGPGGGTTGATAPEAAASEPAGPGTATATATAVAFAEQGGDPHGGVVTEDTPPLVVRLPSSPVRGGARRRPSPRPRPGTHDQGPGRAVPPVVEETPAVVTSAVPAEPLLTEPLADEPLVAEPVAAEPVVDEAAPTAYTIPEAGSPLSPPLDLPASDLAADEPVAPEATTAVTLTKATEPAEPAEPTEPTEAAEAAAAPAGDVVEAEPTHEAETAVEGGVERPGGEPAGTAVLPSGITWWPDREMEQLPTRGPREQRAVVDDTAATAPPVVPPPLRSANEASAATETPGSIGINDILAADPADVGGGAAAVRPWGEGDGRPAPTTSAWSSNGHSRHAAPLAAGASAAWPAPATAAPAGEDAEEPVAPNPYATEHYAGDSPEDQLEEQPPSEGAVGQFLATEQRQQSMPLHGVHGVSITLIVSDLERSRRFYRDTLGLTELDSGESAAVLATGDARVVLRRVADMPPVDRRVVHLNLEVPDVYEAYERLREQGVDFVHRPRVVPQGEQLELCSATFRDPDGHAIALTKWELRR